MKAKENKNQAEKEIDIDDFLKRKKDELEALKHLLEKLNTENNNKNINTKKQ
jgi:hypothetical protein